MKTFPLPHDAKLIDEDGFMHTRWRDYFSHFHQQFGEIINDDGHVIPSQPTTTIAKIPTNKVGNLVYDSTTNTLKANINGAIHTVTTTP